VLRAPGVWPGGHRHCWPRRLLASGPRGGSARERQRDPGPTVPLLGLRADDQRSAGRALPRPVVRRRSDPRSASATPRRPQDRERGPRPVRARGGPGGDLVELAESSPLAQTAPRSTLGLARGEARRGGTRREPGSRTAARLAPVEGGQRGPGERGRRPARGASSRVGDRSRRRVDVAVRASSSRRICRPKPCPSYDFDTHRGGPARSRVAIGRVRHQERGAA